MKYIILKSNIKSHLAARRLNNVLVEGIGVLNWSLDPVDIDNVLKVVTLDNADEERILELIADSGFEVSHLPD